MNILHFDDFNILYIKENEYDYLIKVESISPFSYCPKCFTADKQGFGKKQVLYMDLPIHGKRVGILVNKKRFRCKKCGGTFFETLDMMSGKRQMTKRLLEYIEKQSLKRTNVSIAKEVGIDEKTVRNIISDFIGHQGKINQYVTPYVMGIDEIHLLKKSRVVITNIRENTILDILENRTKATIEKYLNGIKDKHKIKWVAMNMWKPYKDAVEKILPHATIIVDKFHVVRMANDCLETIRKELMASLTDKERRALKGDRRILLKRKKELNSQELTFLDYLTNNFKKLRLAYELKESFLDIWNSADEKQAKEAYSEWKSKIDDEVKHAFIPILSSMKNWEKEIFAYFRYRYTNAYTESSNSMIRAINRMDRGYSFEVIRAKMLFSEGVRKVEKSNYNTKSSEMIVSDTNPKSLFPSKGIDNGFDYGADISILIKKLENGEI